MEKSKDKTKDNKCMSLFKDFIYLSFHNVILIIIINLIQIQKVIDLIVRLIHSVIIQVEIVKKKTIIKL